MCGKAFSQAGSRNTHERKHNRTAATEEDIIEGGVVAAVSMGGVSKGPKKYRIKRVNDRGGLDESMQH